MYTEWDDWYKEHLPSKKSKSWGAASGSPSVIVDSEFLNVDTFVDYLHIDTGAGGAGAPAAGVALAAAAAVASTGANA